MSQTTQGTFSVQNDDLSASFVIPVDGHNRTYRLNGKLSSPFTPFTAKPPDKGVTLSYNSVDDLIGKTDIFAKSRVGETFAEFYLSNNVKLKGDLSVNIVPSTSVTGTATWAASGKEDGDDEE